eukprot:COSAG02_NODE_5141_length_4595_cov_1.739991_3_plen_260_part_00
MIGYGGYGDILDTKSRERYGGTGKYGGAANPLDEEIVNDFLRQKGYDGEPLSVCFKTDVELWTHFFDSQEVHKRVVLRDVVGVIFEAADADADGSITFGELVDWVKTQKISSIDDVSQVFFKYDSDEFGGGGYGYSEDLSFGEFKQLLLGEGLIAVNDEAGAEGRLQIQESLLGLVAQKVFDRADTDDDGTISKTEVAEVMKTYQLVANESVDESFAKVDRDQDGTISYEEFKTFLLNEGVLELAPPQEEKSLFASLFG